MTERRRVVWAVEDQAATDEDTPVTIDVLANDYDPEGGMSIVYVCACQPGGSVAINTDGTIQYTPAPDFNGWDYIYYQVVDDQNYTDWAYVNITVRPVNDGPAADADDAYAAYGAPVDIYVQVGDTDVDGDALMIAGVGQPKYGWVWFNGTMLEYKGDPNSDYDHDSFDYTLVDGHGGCTTTTVEVMMVGNLGYMLDREL